MAAGAIAALLVVALGAVLVLRDDDGGGQLTAIGSVPTTAATIATMLSPTTVATTVPAPITSSVPSTVTTASSQPAGATTRPAGAQLTTTAGGHGPMQAALTQARQRWLAARPAQGYLWTYQRACRCSPRRVEVTVDGAGSVTSVRELDGAPSAQPAEVGLTVDAALNQVQAAVDANAARIDARFDPVRGLPFWFSVDRSTRVADEELGLALVTFTPRS